MPPCPCRKTLWPADGVERTTQHTRRRDERIPDSRHQQELAGLCNVLASLARPLLEARANAASVVCGEIGNVEAA